MFATGPYSTQAAAIAACQSQNVTALSLPADPVEYFQPIMTEDERTELYLLLRKVDGALYDRQYCLCWGALLGYVRFGEMTPWDDDIDLFCIDPPSVDELRKRLPDLVVLQEGYCIKIFNPNGRKIEGKQHRFPFVEINTSTIVEGDYIRCKAGFGQPEDVWPKDLLLPVQRGNFGGEWVNLPAKPKELVVAKYSEASLTTAKPPYWNHKTEQKTGFPQVRVPLDAILKPEAYLINLDRRPDRLAEAAPAIEQAGYRMIRWPAVDGNRCGVPSGYRAGGGAYGCKMSHVAVLKDALERGLETVTVFEDDVVFTEGFQAKLAVFMAKVPDDWQAVFLGGQHIKPPTQLAEGVVHCTDCHRTHAYVLRGEYIRKVLEIFEATDTHIDHAWGAHQLADNPRVYAPEQWMCGQGAGKSDINGRQLAERYWKPSQIKKPKPKPAVRPLRAQATDRVIRMCEGGCGKQRSCCGKPCPWCEHNKKKPTLKPHAEKVDFSTIAENAAKFGFKS